MHKPNICVVFFLFAFYILIPVDTKAQSFSINTSGLPAKTSAALDVDMLNKGLLIPRVALITTTLFAPVTGSPEVSLLVFNTANDGTGNTAVTPGYYYWDGTTWTRLSNGTSNAWSLQGDAGTTAGTNFLGTTDAQDLVIKTGGNAANNERLRVLSTGAIAINNSTSATGDVFSVYGTGYTGAINALGSYGINSYVGANGTAMYGESNSATFNNGTALYGSLIGAQTATGNSSNAVFGINSAVPQGTGISYGVQGRATASSGDARGVNGLTNSGNGIGVAGFNNATTGAGYGVYGQTSSVAGIGVYGVSSAAAYSNNTSTGVFGRTFGSVTTGFSIAVRGLSEAATGLNVYGFYGQSFSSAGTGGIAFVTSSGAGWQGQNAGTGEGVRGLNTNATATNAGSGVLGQTNATSSFGGDFSNFNSTGTGIFTSGNNVSGTYLSSGSGGAFNGLSTGLLANSTSSTNGVGVYGRSNGAAILGMTGGVGVSGSSTLFGVSGFATSTANGILRAGGYFDTNAGQSFAYVGARTAGNVVRKIEGNGTVNTTVHDINDNLVVLSCPEAPENFFQDYGSGQLVNGFAHIELDPILAKNIVVNTKHPLRVFIQLEGDCNGVFVLNKTGTSFDVKELAGGISNVSFSWTITANRADEVLSDGSISKYSEERFAPAMGPMETKVLESKTMTRDDANIIKTPLPIDEDTDSKVQTPVFQIIKKDTDVLRKKTVAPQSEKGPVDDTYINRLRNQ